MRRTSRHLWAAVLLAAMTASAGATSLRVDYRISLAGLPLGVADLTGSFSGERYDLKMNAQLTGLAGLFTGSGRGGAASTGTLSGTRLLTSGFSANGRSGGAERVVQVGLSAGNVSEVKIEPPFELRPDRVPVTEAHMRGIIDPLSAVVAVAAKSGKPDDPGSCNRSVPVFDGTQRFNIVLSYAETKPVQKPGFSGNVLVCNIRYVPVSGHRTSRPVVKFMEENRDMSVWYAPVEGTRVLVPLRISLRTTLGVSVVEAERWNVE